MKYLSPLLTPFFAAALAGPVLAAGPQLTRDEKLVVAYWQSRGVDRMLLLNEQRGKLMAIENGKIVSQGNAISGKIKGDDVTKDDRVTPAGLFPLEPVGTLKEPYIIFKQYGRVTYAIHPTFNVRGENREVRLQSISAADKRLSAGCVNVSRSDFDEYMRFVWGPKQTYEADDGTYRYANVMVVMPEQTSVLKFFNIPADFKPAP